VKTYSPEQAMRAQKAPRDAAGLGPEMFPVQAFVGMISDEIEKLRSQGKSDQDNCRPHRRKFHHPNNRRRNRRTLCSPGRTPATSRLVFCDLRKGCKFIQKYAWFTSYFGITNKIYL
jgi:hypothetical protein